MKQFKPYLLAMVLISSHLAVSSQEREVDSKIEHVTVFFRGAQIERTTTSVTLPTGQSVLAVKGLEQSLVESSLRAGIKGSGTIQTIVKRIDYLNLKKSTSEIESLNARLKQLDEQIEEERMKVKVYEQERNFLAANMHLGGANTGVSVSQIKEGAVYFRSRMTEVETLMLQGNRKLKTISEEKTKINNQLAELNYKKNRPTSTIEITVEMDKAGACSLLLDYYIPAAFWRPTYDLRVDKVGDPVHLIRKASVSQSSGEDWNDVLLSFSTGNPMENQVLPSLTTWYLNAYTPPKRSNVSYMNRAQPSAKRATEPMAMEVAESATFDADAFDKSGSASDVTKSSKNSILEFSLSTKGKIPSDNNEYLFSIGTDEMDAAYHYQTVPKLNRSAYLMATVNDWEGFELVDGTANIYYENSLIGETYLNSSTPLDSIQLSLGKDRGIVVERKTIKEYTRSRIVGSNVRKSYGYEISIRNTKQIEVELVLEDQVPVSANSEISVDIEEKGKGELDQITGKVTWRMSVKPGETVKVLLKYSIKYPKNMKVNL